MFKLAFIAALALGRADETGDRAFVPLNGTAHPDLSREVAYANQHGFNVVAYSLNGTGLNGPEAGAAFATALVDAGIAEDADAYAVGFSRTANGVAGRFVSKTRGGERATYCPTGTVPVYFFVMNLDEACDQDVSYSPAGTTGACPSPADSWEGKISASIDDHFDHCLDARNAYGFNTESTSDMHCYVILTDPTDEDFEYPPERRSGAPLGNQNAVGNRGGPPLGNTNGAGGPGGGAALGNTNGRGARPFCIVCLRNHKPGNCKAKKQKTQGTKITSFFSVKHKDDAERGPPGSGPGRRDPSGPGGGSGKLLSI